MEDSGSLSVLLACTLRIIDSLYIMSGYKQFIVEDVWLARILLLEYWERLERKMEQGLDKKERYG